MRYDDLKSQIQPHLNASVEDVYAEFRTATGKDDLDTFLMFLQQRSLISLEAFRELAAKASVELGPISETAPGAGGTHGIMAATLIQGASRSLDSAANAAPEERPNYAMMGMIGEGSMGRIYLAKDLNLRRKVAYKELKGELAAASPDIRERFINEAQITAQMDHPNVVPVYALENKGDGSYAYVMKLVQGKTLKDLVTETKALHDHGKPLDDDHSLPARLEYFLKVCDAMSYAHSKGVIHRDLKPANIMIGRYNEVYVMDWGIARMVSSIMQPEATTMIELARKDGHMPVIEPTQAGQAVGTPRYMSPEQAAGANMDLDEKSDLYTLGTIMFELVCLKPAITGNSLKEAMVNVMKGNLEPFEHYKPKIKLPSELNSIVKKATVLDRVQRYGSVREFADDIRRYLRGEPVSVEPDKLSSKLQRWISHHRQATLLIVMALLLTSASVLIWSLARESQARARSVRHAEVLSQATDQAQRLDGEVGRMVALLDGLRAAALLVLDRPAPEGVAAHAEADFTANVDALALAPAKAYGGKAVSVAHPIVVVAPDASPGALAPELARLAGLSESFARVVLASKGGDDVRASVKGPRLAQVVRDDGAPVVRAYVSLASGAHVSFPGVATFPPDFDARKTAWYRRAIDSAGVHWGPPKVCGQGQGLVVTASVALIDASGQIRGVAGLDVSVPYLIEHYLKRLDAAAVDGCYLLNRKGEVLLASTDATGPGLGPGKQHDSETPLAALDVPGAVKLAGLVGPGQEVVGDKLLVACPLHGMMGTYLVVVDPSKMR